MPVQHIMMYPCCLLHYTIPYIQPSEYITACTINKPDTALIKNNIAENPDEDYKTIVMRKPYP